MPARRAPTSGVTVDQVRALALALPETTEKPSYGTPGFRVADKLFARILEDRASMTLAVDFDAREALVAAEPALFSVTPHYERYEWVIVSLAAVGTNRLRALLKDAWARRAPRRLLAITR